MYISKKKNYLCIEEEEDDDDEEREERDEINRKKKLEENGRTIVDKYKSRAQKNYLHIYGGNSTVSHT